MSRLIADMMRELSPNSSLVTYANMQNRNGQELATNFLEIREPLLKYMELIKSLLESKIIDSNQIPKSLLDNCRALKKESKMISLTNNWQGINFISEEILSHKEQIGSALIESIFNRFPYIGRNVSEMIKTISSHLESASTANEKIENFVQKLPDEKRSIKASKKEIDKLLETSVDSQKNIAKNLESSTTLINDIEELKGKSEESIKIILEDATTSKDTKDKAESHLAELTKTLESANQFAQGGIRRQNQLLDSLILSEEKAKSILAKSTTAALAQHWSEQEKKAKRTQTGIAVVLCITVILSICISLLLVLPSLLADLTLKEIALRSLPFQETMLIKLFVLPPFIFAIWFLSHHYAVILAVRREYMMKETVAKTLDSYKEYAVQLASETGSDPKEVFVLFTSTIKDLYSADLQRNIQESGNGKQFQAPWQKNKGNPSELRNLIESIGIDNLVEVLKLLK